MGNLSISNFPTMQVRGKEESLNLIVLCLPDILLFIYREISGPVLLSPWFVSEIFISIFFLYFTGTWCYVVSQVFFTQVGILIAANQSWLWIILIHFVSVRDFLFRELFLILKCDSYFVFVLCLWSSKWALESKYLRVVTIMTRRNLILILYLNNCFQIKLNLTRSNFKI